MRLLTITLTTLLLTACITIGDQAGYFKGLKGQQLVSVEKQLGYPSSDKVVGTRRIVSWDYPNTCHVDAEVKDDTVVGVSWYGDLCHGIAVSAMKRMN